MESFLYSDVSDEMLEVRTLLVNQTFWLLHLLTLRITATGFILSLCQRLSFLCLFQNPHPAEPSYVASARLQILSELRETKQLSDDACALLIDSFMFNLKADDQVLL